MKRVTISVKDRHGVEHKICGQIAEGGVLVHIVKGPKIGVFSMDRFERGVLSKKTLAALFSE